MRQQGLEALSKKDGAWYDVDCTRTKIRDCANGPCLRVRFRQFDAGEDELYTFGDLNDHFRLRSRPMLDRQCGEVHIGCGVVGLAHLEEHQESKWIDATVIEIKRKNHQQDKCQCSFKVQWKIYDSPGFCQPSRDWLDIDSLCSQSAPNSHLTHSFITRWKEEIKNRCSQAERQHGHGRLSLPGSWKQGAGGRKRMYSGVYGLSRSMGTQRVRSLPTKFTRFAREAAVPGGPIRRGKMQDMAGGRCGYGLLVDLDDGSVSSDSCGVPGWATSKVVRHIPVPKPGSRNVSTRPLIRKSCYVDLYYGARNWGHFRVGNAWAAHGSQKLQYAKSFGWQAANIKNGKQVRRRRGKRGSAYGARCLGAVRVLSKSGRTTVRPRSLWQNAHRTITEPDNGGLHGHSGCGKQALSVISDGRIAIEGCTELQGFPYVLDSCDKKLKAEWYQELGNYT